MWLPARQPRTHLHVPDARCARVRRVQEHVDYLSLQALMLKEAPLGVVAQTRLLLQHTKRLAG